MLFSQHRGTLIHFFLSHPMGWGDLWVWGSSPFLSTVVVHVVCVVCSNWGPWSCSCCPPKICCPDFANCCLEEAEVIPEKETVRGRWSIWQELPQSRLMNYKSQLSGCIAVCRSWRSVLHHSVSGALACRKVHSIFMGSAAESGYSQVCFLHSSPCFWLCVLLISELGLIRIPLRPGICFTESHR